MFPNQGMFEEAEQNGKLRPQQADIGLTKDALLKDN